MSTTLGKYQPLETFKRYRFIPSATVVAPSGTGKTSFCSFLVNHQLLKIIRQGIGETNQTTKIETIYVLDSSIPHEDEFAISIKEARFNNKLLLETIFECFKKQKSIPTLEDIDRIIAPAHALYTLEQVREINQELLLAIVTQMVEQNRFDYSTFDEFAENIPELVQWVKQIETILQEQLQELYDAHALYSLQRNEDRKRLVSLIDPKSPYSLCIKEIQIACKPNERIAAKYIEQHPNIPFRFAIRDTMGINQQGSTEAILEDALEHLLEINTDSLILLFSLTERKDVIEKTCELLNQKLPQYQDTNKPLYVFFTKLDELVESKVSLQKEGDILTQLDYDRYVAEAINDTKCLITRITDKIDYPNLHIEITTLRHRDFSIDPIQIALRDHLSMRKRFTVDYLLAQMQNLIVIAHNRFLQEGESKVPVTVIDLNEENPHLDVIRVKDIIGLEEFFTQQFYPAVAEKAKVEYFDDIVQPEKVYHGNSVSTYFDKLLKGFRHQTRANYFSNFDLHMKGIIYNALATETFSTIIKQHIAFDFTNIRQEDLLPLITHFSQDVLSPDVHSKLSQPNVSRQTLEIYLQKVLYGSYFQTKNFHYLLNTIIDTISLQLSFTDNEINDRLVTAYSYYSRYSASLKNLQQEFYRVYSDNNFKGIFTRNIYAAIGEQLTKHHLFVL